MKRGQIILLISLVLGCCMFYCSRFLHERASATAGQEMSHENGSMLPELEWLRQWLRLTDIQFEQVKALHLAYLPKCRLNCARIGAAEAALLEASAKPMDELTEQLQALAAAQIECRQAMLAHVRQTTACMNDEQARQYQNVLLPHVLGLGRHCASCPQHSR